MELIDKAEDAEADLIEIRLDKLDKYNRLADLAAHGKTPKIATNKLFSCYGNFKGTVTKQKEILLAAAKTGFNYVDIDLTTSNLKAFAAQIDEIGAKLIVSFHDYKGALKLEELNSVLEREISSGANVCKIVTTAKRLEDNLTLLNFSSAASKKCSVVCFGMGEIGKVSRFLSPLFGCEFTFAALESGNETAPGQMTIQEMRSAYELLGV